MKKSFVRKLVLTYILILILPYLGFTLYSLPEMSRSYIRQYSTIVSDSVNTLNGTLDKRISNLYLNADAVVSENQLTSLLASGRNTRNLVIIETLTQKLLPSLAHLYGVNKDIAQAVIVHANPIIPNVYYRIYQNPEALNAVMSRIESGEYLRYSNKNLFFSGVGALTHYQGGDVRGAGKRVLSFYYPIRSLFQNTILGFVQQDVHVDELFQGMIPFLTIAGSYVSIVQRDGTVVYTTFEGTLCLADETLGQPKEGPTHVRLGDIEYIRYAYRLPVINMYCVGYLPMASVFADRSAVMLQYFLVLGVILLICSYVLYRIARMQSKNLVWLSGRVEKISQGHLDVDTRVNGADEVSLLGDTIWRMEESMRALLKRTEDLGNSERKAVYAGLINQMKPHFLCNTLNTLRIGANRQGAVALSRSLELVINYFRYNMSDMNQCVTIRQEIGNARDYVSLNNIICDQSCGQVALTIRFEGEAMLLQEKYVLKYLLQPLIENSIVHGFAGGTRSGEVDICFCAKRDRLTLTVEDDGCGMEPDRLEALKERLDARARDDYDVGRTKKIGLENLESRLHLHFGGAAHMQIVSNPLFGTKIVLQMPVLSSPDGFSSRRDAP